MSNKSVKVLLLRDCALGQAGSVAEVSSEDAATYKAHGMVDDHPDAVAFVNAAPSEAPAEAAPASQEAAPENDSIGKKILKKAKEFIK